ncbi:hypothetical protein PG999_011806 [Apiospora kogelbergensis]|uniref:Uncharacterized protein n=1 Tax=Apiospora kogelbergensis TaxID=1337665 RepID=A0AAW0QFC1_9PEZI
MVSDTAPLPVVANNTQELQSPILQQPLDTERAKTNDSHSVTNKSSDIDGGILEEAQQAPNRPSVVKAKDCNAIPSKLQVLKMQLAAITTSLALLGFVIAYVQATYDAQWSSQQGLPLTSLLKTKDSTILAVLRTSQGLLSMLNNIAIDGAFNLLQWNGMLLPKGLSYSALLSLSPSTSAWGTIGIIRSGNPPLSIKALATVREPGVNTTSVTVYDTGLIYNVTAGVGRFNGSLVQPFKTFLHTIQPGYPYETIPYNYIASVYTLVLDPLLSTVAETQQCSVKPCVSYLITGGLTTVIPWVPRDYMDYSLVKVEKAPSIQADFTGPLPNNIVFSDSECDTFGQDGILIGIRLCLRMHPSEPGLVMAGMFVCPKGIIGDACSIDNPSPNITTQVSFHSLHSSFLSSRQNYTITSVTETTDAVLITDLEMPAYRDALRWLLNYTDANMPPHFIYSRRLLDIAEATSRPIDVGNFGSKFPKHTCIPVLVV